MNRIRIFEAHGVTFTGSCGDQAYGRCPFTGKSDKFYVNTNSMLWDSKTAGLSGNIPQFLKFISEQYTKHITPAQIKALAEDRHLPESAFKGWHLGWTGNQYTIPVADAGGTLTDIRLYRIGQKTISTPGAFVGLLGAEHLPKHPDWPIYLCEGEWDTIALAWLLRKLKVPGLVLGVPGAGVLKQEWVPWFSGRRIHTLYDHDEYGENGELLAQKRLKGVAQVVTFTHWPDGLKTGFDVRDWIIHGAIEKNTPEKCWTALQELFRPHPRKTDLERRSQDRQTGEPINGTPADRKMKGEPIKTAWPRPPALAEVFSTFKKWLFLDNTDGISVMLATVVSQVLDGPPVWLFMVGPPGCAKTETLSSLSIVPQIYMTSSLTPHALISGANWKDNVDPSLIPRLNGKIMVIKDFTSILTMRDTEKDEIFGILRDAFDGKCGKVFGTGIERSYESRFTILAAVTPSIYALSSQHTSLGERFLKFAIGDNLVHRSETDIISRAIDNIDFDSKMKAELADVVNSFLMRRLSLDHIKKHPPQIPNLIKERVVYLARFGARMRGTVSRDTYRNEIITSRPSAEVGSRLGMQLAKMGKALAAVGQRPSMNEDDYRLLKKVVIDTIPQRTEDMLRALIKACPTADEYITAQDLAHATRYPIATVIRILQDLNVLDIVSRHGTVYKYSWTVSPYIRECIDKAQLYRTTEELERPMRLWARVRKGRRSKQTLEQIEVA